MSTSSPKNAVVIGATGNLGSAVCSALEAAGFKIDERWRSPDHPDATNPESYRDLPEVINAAIYLAGINVVKDISDMTLEEWNNVLAVNLTGAFLFAQAAEKGLKAATDSTFITISSIMVTHPYPKRTAYAASKAGIEGLTRTLAVEWGAAGISCISLRLGHLAGLMKTTTPNPQLLSAVKSFTPAGTLIEPKDVASLIVHLVNGGAKSMNGSVIDVDPAYTINRWPL